jgi:hypothetical protein
MNREGILRAKLQTLENHATALEKAIYNDLVTAERYANTEGLEARTWCKAERLDGIQDDIDGIIAELKSEGWYKPMDYSGTYYIYKPRKLKKPKLEAPPKVRTPRTVYPAKAPKAAKPTRRKTDREVAEARQAREAAKAAREAERLRIREERRAERKALREASRPVRTPKQKPAPKPKSVRAPKVRPEPKPKVVRPPKAKPVPKPRKPAESRELMLAKKRRDSVIQRINSLDSQIAAERAKLAQRIVERQIKLAEVAHTPTAEYGAQKRAAAKAGLDTANKRLAEIDKRHAERLESLNAQLEQANHDIQLLSENNSQV